MHPLLRRRASEKGAAYAITGGQKDVGTFSRTADGSGEHGNGRAWVRQHRYAAEIRSQPLRCRTKTTITHLMTSAHVPHCAAKTRHCPWRSEPSFLPDQVRTNEQTSQFPLWDSEESRENPHITVGSYHGLGDDPSLRQWSYTHAQAHAYPESSHKPSGLVGRRDYTEHLLAVRKSLKPNPGTRPDKGRTPII